MATVKVKGLQETLRGVDEASRRIQDNIVLELERSAQATRTEAQSRVPTDTARLKASIRISRPDKFKRAVGTNVEYAPFIEFGTKSKVDIPSGLERVAAQYKGAGGSFDDLLDNVAQWVRRQGIDEAAVYPIALKIAREGVRPQPFLFAPANAEGAELYKRLKRWV